MHVKQAAIQVLQQTGGPLTAQQVCEQILGQDLWTSKGNTPEATVAAQLYSDIKKHGEASPFVQLGPNTFGLRDSSAASDPASPAVGGASKPAGAPQVSARYSFTDAAEKVLEQYGGKKPMHG